jgi:IS5 family transposase
MFGDAGYAGVAKLEETQDINIDWHAAMRTGKCKKSTPICAIMCELEKIIASIRAQVDQPFWVIKRQFGNAKVRYRCLMKNTAQLQTLFALSNLWMTRHMLLQRAQG